MNKILPCLLLLALACDPAPLPELRDGSSGDGCEMPPMPPTPPLEGCACDPEAPSCKPGLDCVPIGEGKEHACLARCGGGMITTCQADGQDIACAYPFWSEQAGTGPAYCPVCLSCAPPPVGTMICQ